MVFRSRISIIIVALLVGTLGCAAVQAIYTKDPISIGIILATIIFVAVLVFSTCYIIDGNVLYVRVFPFTRGSAYDLTKVVSISRTRSMLSSPAWSLKRIKLDFGVGQPLIISPKALDLFIEEVRKVNPQVAINI